MESLSKQIFNTQHKNNLDIIEQKLGKPYYRDDTVLLYNMDCIDLLSKINSKCFDLTITSPPYNIGKEYEIIQKHDDYLQ